MRAASLVCVGLTAGAGAGAPPDPAEVAAAVDRHLAARWAAATVTPAEPADDAAFARRLYLDLVGRVPTAAEARGFLDDPAADKRDRLAARLLAGPAHARHWAAVWRREWLPQADQPGSPLADDVEPWLADRLRDRTSLAAVARDLLTAAPAGGPGDRRPAAFLAAAEHKPDNLAANTARAFLGVNLDCAQCHDHPFARWTQDQFWETAAFFARPAAGAGKPDIAVAGGDRRVGPRFLTGTPPDWPAAAPPGAGPALLAAWVTAADNPFFARNAVNRVWAQLFGTGLVEPLDDLSDSNPASHPRLLDELAAGFAAGGCDPRPLIEGLVRSRAYRLSSVVPAGGSDDPRLFARAAVRGLTGEQLYDSLRTAAGLPPDRPDLDPDAARPRKRFAEAFRAERGAAARRSVVQSLALMNGPLTATAADPAGSPTVRAAADAPFLDGPGKVEAVFLAAVGRRPSAAEVGRVVAAVGADRLAADPPAALADVLWALVNGSEFNTNH